MENEFIVKERKMYSRVDFRIKEISSSLHLLSDGCVVFKRPGVTGTLVFVGCQGNGSAVVITSFSRWVLKVSTTV